MADNTCKKRRRTPRFTMNYKTGKYEKAPTRKRPHTNRHLHEKRLHDAMNRTLRLARDMTDAMVNAARRVGR